MSGIVEPFFRIFYLLVGSFAAAYYTKSSPAGIERIKAWRPKWEQHSYEIFDFWVGLLISSIAANVLYAPTDGPRAIIAGFSSVALLKQLLKGPK